MTGGLVNASISSLLNGGASTVVWSGAGTKAVADNLGTTISKTPLGSLLDKSDPVFRSLSSGWTESTWNWASAYFAGNAKGVVQAVLNNPSSTSTFKTVEEPILNLLSKFWDPGYVSVVVH